MILRWQQWFNYLNRLSRSFKCFNQTFIFSTLCRYFFLEYFLYTNDVNDASIYSIYTRTLQRFFGLFTFNLQLAFWTFCIYHSLLTYLHNYIKTYMQTYLYILVFTYICICFCSSVFFYLLSNFGAFFVVIHFSLCCLLLKRPIFNFALFLDFYVSLFFFFALINFYLILFLYSTHIFWSFSYYLSNSSLP